MIFKRLVVDAGMEPATFGSAAVDSVAERLAASVKTVAGGGAAIPIRTKTTIAVMGLVSITAIIMGLLSASPTGGGTGMAAGGGRVRGGAYLQPSLYITLLAPLVSCSASGCSAIKLSMWRMRFSSSISSMAIRMPVSSTSPKP